MLLIYPGLVSSKQKHSHIYVVVSFLLNNLNDTTTQMFWTVCGQKFLKTNTGRIKQLPLHHSHETIVRDFYQDNKTYIKTGNYRMHCIPQKILNRDA